MSLGVVSTMYQVLQRSLMSQDAKPAGVDDLAAMLSALITAGFKIMPEDPDGVHEKLKPVLNYFSKLVESAQLMADANKQRPHSGVNGAVPSASDDEPAEDAEETANGLDSLNKSHMSIVREVAILSWLRSAGFASFAQLKAVAKPFWKDDGDAEKTDRALRTQLSRLKTDGIVWGDGLGQYRLTSEGGEHLAKRTTMYDGLIRLVQPDLLCDSGAAKAPRS